MKELQALAIKDELCFEVSKHTALAFVIKRSPPDLQQLAQRISERHGLVSRQQTHRLDVAYCSFAAAAANAAAAAVSSFGMSQNHGGFQPSSSSAAAVQNAASNNAVSAAAAYAAAAVGISQCNGSFQPPSSSAARAQHIAGDSTVGAMGTFGASNALCVSADDGADRANGVDVSEEDQIMVGGTVAADTPSKLLWCFRLPPTLHS